MIKPYETRLFALFIRDETDHDVLLPQEFLDKGAMSPTVREVSDSLCHVFGCRGSTAVAGIRSRRIEMKWRDFVYLSEYMRQHNKGLSFHPVADETVRLS